VKFLLGAHAFFVLTSVPGIISPSFAAKQYIPVEGKLPTDKGGSIVLDFTLGFQQLAIAMIQSFGGVMIWFAPKIDVMVYFWVFATLYFAGYIFFPNILHADKYGFDRIPMLIFLSMNMFIAGAGVAALYN